MTEVLIVIVLGQMCLIYTLINRLLAANGHKPMRPVKTARDAIVGGNEPKPDTEPVKRKMGNKIGTVKVRL